MTDGTVAGRRRRTERGTAMIEVALTLPLLLLVAIGIFEFGRAFQTWQVLTNAAREGARVAVLPDGDGETVRARVQAYMKSGQLQRWSDADVQVNSSDSVSLGGGNTASASKVTVAYPFDFVVLNPIAQLVAGGSKLGAGPITITASAAMRNESQY